MTTTAAPKKTRRPRGPVVEEFHSVAFGEAARFHGADRRLWLALPIRKFKTIVARGHQARRRALRAQHQLSLVVMQRPELYPLLAPAMSTLANMPPPAWVDGLDLPPTPRGRTDS